MITDTDKPPCRETQPCRGHIHRRPRVKNFPMSYKKVREALSALLHSSGVYPPRDDMQLLTLIHIPIKSGVSASDFQPTGTKFSDLFDDECSTELQSSKLGPQDRSLRQKNLWDVNIALEVLKGRAKSKLTSESCNDLILKDEECVSLEEGKALRFIQNQLRRRSILRKLRETNVGVFAATKKRFLLGVVIKCHTAQAELQASNERGLETGISVPSEVPVEGKGNARREQVLESCGRGIVGVRCILFGFKEDAKGEWLVSNPLVEASGAGKELQDSVRYVRISLFSIARCVRKRKRYWEVELLDDVPDGKLSDEDEEATENALSRPGLSAVINSFGDKNGQENATPYLGESSLHDGILGIHGSDLGKEAIITELDAIGEPGFFDELDWASVKEDE